MKIDIILSAHITVIADFQSLEHLLDGVSRPVNGPGMNQTVTESPVQL